MGTNKKKIGLTIGLSAAVISVAGVIVKLWRDKYKKSLPIYKTTAQLLQHLDDGWFDEFIDGAYEEILSFAYIILVAEEMSQNPMLKNHIKSSVQEYADKLSTITILSEEDIQKISQGVKHRLAKVYHEDVSDWEIKRDIKEIIKPIIKYPLTQILVELKKDLQTEKNATLKELVEKAAKQIISEIFDDDIESPIKSSLDFSVDDFIDKYHMTYDLDKLSDELDEIIAKGE